MSKFLIHCYCKICYISLVLFWVPAESAETIAKYQIPMQKQGSSTFYINSSLLDDPQSLMLVDTGSSHSVINQATMTKLQASGDAKFVKNLQAIMADGSKKIVPLYQIARITLGEGCELHDIKATVISNNARQILGISALQKAAPFGFSFNPPMLTLSHCDSIQSANEMLAAQPEKL